MIYLLFGSDTSRSRQKLNEIVGEFRKRNGSGLNYYNFDAEEDDAGKIKGALGGYSLFSAKKLVILKYFSASPEKEELYKILKRSADDEQTTVILWDRELEAKELGKIKPFCKKVQEFSARGGSAFGGKDTTIFQLGDTFFSSRREALRNLLSLLYQGHDDFNLFSYLANHGRTLSLIKSFQDEERSIPANFGIHPFVIKKAASIVRTLSLEQLHAALGRFFEEDAKIKVGISKPKDSLINMIL